jgi:hypothetical protein
VKFNDGEYINFESVETDDVRFRYEATTDGVDATVELREVDA